MVNLSKKLIALARDDVFKVFSYTAVSTLVRMLTGLVSVKFVAVLIGPSGVALLGQLTSFSSIILIVASAGINNGVTKYLAENKTSTEEIRKLLSSAFIITLLASLVTGLALFVFANWISKLILLDDSFSYIFKIFGLTVTFYSLNSLLVSILNGFKEFKLFVIINVVGSIVGLLFTITLVHFWGVDGALVSVVTFQSVVFFISIFFVQKSSWLRVCNFNKATDFLTLKRFGNYSLMTLVTAATAPISQLILRGYIITAISPNTAGWWEAMNRISNMYLLVVTASFSVYYLPRLSEITNDKDLNAEILKGFKFIIPILFLGFAILYFSRFIVIKLLFSKNFIGMESLFIWQLIGDFFKITSWLLAYIMVAKAMTKAFVISEILITFFFIILAYWMLNNFGIVGITQAYAVNYFVYFVAMVVLFRKIIFLRYNG